MPPGPVESPELVALFTTYTASPDSIGAHLAPAAVRAAEHDPLLVVTGTDPVLYPGGGAAPAIEPYRLATRGFKELASISHLGPAVATLATLRELAGDGPGDDTGDGRGQPAIPNERGDDRLLLRTDRAVPAAQLATAVLGPLIRP